MTTLAPELDRARLVSDNLDLLAIEAQKLLAGGLAADLDDLIQEGYRGLRKAAERFCPERGYQFATFARHRIRGAMLDYARSEDWLPRRARRNINLMDRASSRFIVREHRFPTLDELAGELGWAAGELARARRQAQEGTLVSFQSEVRKRHAADDQTVTLADVVPDPDADTERQALDGIDRGRATALLMRLTERERFIVSLYFYEDMTLAQIARVLGVTESRVSQIRTRALGRLRRMLAPEMAA